jgi:hypothetical protein
VVLIEAALGLPAALTLAPDLDQTGNFCVFAMVTGKPCPACGGTRVMLDLLRLDPMAALEHNLLITLGLVAVALTLLLRWRRVVATFGAPDRIDRALTAVSAPLARRPVLVSGVFALAWAWNLARW